MYQRIKDSTSIRHIESGAIIPMPAAEPMGFAYEAWLAGGNTPEPAPDPEPPTLAQRREAVWTAVKVERARREYGGVLVSGHWFQTDLESQIKHQSNLIDAKDILAAGGSNADPLTIGGQPIGWKTFDNGVVPMTVGLAVGIAGAIKIQTALAYARGQALYAEIMASEDPESIDITTGWPPVFGG